ncbi:MAG: hypothetical protein AAFX79_10230 [Planctomycetota bacterium]
MAAALDRGPWCIRCGYELAGLSHQGVCPECAAPIRDSLFASPLADDPRYREALRDGAATIRVGLVIAVPFGVCLPFVLPLALLLLALGVWRVTRPAPRVLTHEGEVVRRRLRWSMTLATMLIAAWLASLFGPSAIEPVQWALGLGGGAALLLAVHSTPGFLQWLGERGRISAVRAAANATRVSAWGLILGSIVLGIAVLLDHVVPGLGGWMELIGGGSALVVLLCAILFAVQVFAVAGDLRQALPRKVDRSTHS